MPELPEVETVMRGLAPVMEGQKIVNAIVRRDGLRWPFPEGMAERITGAHVLGLQRRSKYILMALDCEETLIVHLGMSGKFLILNDKKADKIANGHPDYLPHDHVIFQMEHGAEIRYNDPRRFGMMDLCATGELDAHRLLTTIGPEPLSNQFHPAYLEAALSTRKTAIKTALLDQTIVAGLGNIYVCEVLFRAKIHPITRANSLSPDMVNAVVAIIRDVLNEAIASGGSSLKDYRQADGDLGYFQHQFQVYGRTAEPCVTRHCSAKIERINQAGRSSFFCPDCQVNHDVN